MWQWALIPLVLALGAIGRRIAGGGLNQWVGDTGGVNSRVMGDTPARLIFGLLCAVCGLLGGMPWMMVPLIVIAVWVGTTTGNTGIAMGRGNKTTFSQDWWACAIHGMECDAAVSAVTGYWFWDHPARWVLVGLGWLTCPVWYEMAWDITGLKGVSWLPVGFRTGSDLAEAIWGAVCALCLFAAFVQ